MNITTNNSFLCEKAITALKQVSDPEIGLNIVDLGLVYQIDFDEESRKVYCTMTLTTQFCPMGESIVDAAKRVLVEDFPGNEIILNLTFNPPWNHEKISETGREYLNN